MKYNAQDIRKSKDEAIAKIELYLSSEDVIGQFENINGDYYSKDKFIVTWKSNYNGMASEGGIHKVDPFYTAYSGYKAIWADVGLFHEKQHKGYSDIWRALIMVGAELVLPSKKYEWLKKYAPRYNEWINSLPATA